MGSSCEQELVNFAHFVASHMETASSLATLSPSLHGPSSPCSQQRGRMGLAGCWGKSLRDYSAWCQAPQNQSHFMCTQAWCPLPLHHASSMSDAEKSSSL